MGWRINVNFQKRRKIPDKTLQIHCTFRILQKSPVIRSRSYEWSVGTRLLHQQQIALLRVWSGQLANEQTAQADALLPKLLLSINAIASGLRTTGWINGARDSSRLAFIH